MKGDAGDRVLRLEGQDVKALVLELVAEPCLGLRDVHAFDDFPGGRRKPAAELHSTVDASV
jgi:hypothetical protein